MFLRQMDYVPTKNNITSIVYCNASCLCHNRVTGEKKWPFLQKKQTCQQTSKQQYISFLMTILWLSDLTFLTLPIKPTAFTRNSQRRRRAQRSMKTLTIGITIALDIFIQNCIPTISCILYGLEEEWLFVHYVFTARAINNTSIFLAFFCYYLKKPYQNPNKVTAEKHNWIKKEVALVSLV